MVHCGTVNNEEGALLDHRLDVFIIDQKTQTHFEGVEENKALQKVFENVMFSSVKTQSAMRRTELIDLKTGTKERQELASVSFDSGTTASLRLALQCSCLSDDGVRLVSRVAKPLDVDRPIKIKVYD